MSNRIGICWKCVHREDCKMFNKNPKAEVTECGRFLMKDGDRAIMQMLYEHFMAESEEQMKTNTHIVIKREDIFKYLTDNQIKYLDAVLNRIADGRKKDGKKSR